MKGSSGISFLAFMANHIKAKHPEACNFIDDVNPCREAARVESAYLEGLVKKVEVTMTSIEKDLKQKNEDPKDKYLSVMGSFFVTADKETKKLLDEYKKLLDKCEE